MSGRFDQRAIAVETDDTTSIRHQNTTVTEIVNKRAQTPLRWATEAEGRGTMIQPPEGIIPPPSRCTATTRPASGLKDHQGVDRLLAA